MSTDSNATNSLDDWIELVRSQNMPIFDHTVQRVIKVAGNDLAPMSDLAGVILQDASMTARVLKLANSILYNPSATGISTVTRAVIVLGMNAVRNICLTLTLIDTLVKGDAKERLGRELGRTMHAAVQARALAAAQGDKSPEEVFIATLLYRVGELAFWCFGGEQADRVEQLMRQGAISPEQAQERVLGFRLSQLSRQLVREWRLTELLQEAINHPAHKDQRIESIMLGQKIARCAEQRGWHSKEMDQLVKKAASLSSLPEEEARTLLFQKARVAASVVTDYGASFAAPHIPLPARHDENEVEFTPDDATDVAGADATEEQAPQRDTKLQIKILRELTSVLEGRQCNFNVIMELVLEGIFRGVGMDRVVFALKTPDKQALKAKYALGADWAGLSDGFNFARPSKGQDILFQTIDHKCSSLVTPGGREDMDRLIPEQLTRLTGPTAFMVAPIIIDNQCIGLFYADRGPSKRPLDSDSFEDFKHFVHQASIGLTIASVRRS